jgi:hypothetical protein
MLVFLRTQYGITIAKQNKTLIPRCRGLFKTLNVGVFEHVNMKTNPTKGIDINIRGFNQKAARTFPLNN